MTAFSCAVVFILGAIIASFVGVVGVRLHTGQHIVRGRSRCDACAKPLAPHTLVPVLSYLVSGGRSSCCGTKISFVSPLSEAILGSVFVLGYMKLGLSLAFMLFCLASSLLLLLVAYDLTHHILPPVPLYLFVGVSAAAQYGASPSTFLDTVTLAAFLAFCIASIHVLSRGRAMGFADAPLVFGLSLLVGGAAFAGLIFSFWIGAAIGIVILARRPRGSRMGVEVPFAPFLAAGFLLAYFTQWNPFLFIAAIHL